MSDDKPPTEPGADPDIIRVRLVRAIKTVQIEDENGQVQDYTVREMTGAEKGRWQTVMSKRMRFDSKGQPAGIADWTGLEGSLITKCLYDSNGKQVPETVIANWPTTVQKTLFALCQKINGLTDEDEEKAKNG